jgi:hypothetical protein
LLEMLLAAGAPVLLDFIKSTGGAISRKWFGLSVDDQIKIDNAQVTKLEALAKLDNPYGTPSQWVVDLRASFRYIGAGVVILIGAGLLYVGYQPAIDDDNLIQLGANFIGMPFAFIFGERLMLNLKGSQK